MAGEQETSGLGPYQQFNRYHFDISALSSFKLYIDVCHSNKIDHIVLIQPWSCRQTVAILHQVSVHYARSAAGPTCVWA